MSIATEITRLQTTKANIKSAIEGKGVTVSSSATLDAYASLISSIPTGGGGSTLLARGSYTPTEDVYAANVQIPHSLGVQPDFVIVCADALTASVDYAVPYIVYSVCSKIPEASPQTTNGAWASYVYTRQTYNQTQYSSESVVPTKFLDASWIKVPYYSSSQMLKSGVTYNYVIGKYTAE